MLGKITEWLNGRKSYLAGLGWMVYKLGVASGWWPENPTIETLIVGGGALAFREAIGKAEKK